MFCDFVNKEKLSSKKIILISLELYFNQFNYLISITNANEISSFIKCFN